MLLYAAYRSGKLLNELRWFIAQETVPQSRWIISQTRRIITDLVCAVRDAFSRPSDKESLDREICDQFGKLRGKSFGVQQVARIDTLKARISELLTDRENPNQMVQSLNFGAFTGQALYSRDVRAHSYEGTRDYSGEHVAPSDPGDRENALRPTAGNSPEGTVEQSLASEISLTVRHAEDARSTNARVRSTGAGLPEHCGPAISAAAPGSACLSLDRHLMLVCLPISEEWFTMFRHRWDELEFGPFPASLEQLLAAKDTFQSDDHNARRLRRQKVEELIEAIDDAFKIGAGGASGAQVVDGATGNALEEVVPITQERESKTPPAPPNPPAADQRDPPNREGEQGEGTGANRGEGTPESEGAGADRDQGGPYETSESRPRAILETMLEHTIVSHRSRKNCPEIVRLINRKHNAKNYGRDFAALVKGGFLENVKGPKAGYWLTPKGKAEAQRLRTSSERLATPT